ncbi:MAG: hypothetical protein ACRC41_17620 [Sarcina sp.]
MKKLIILLVVLIVGFTLTGCLKSDKLEENKITAPVPTNLEIDGTWEVTAQYSIVDNKLEQVKDIKKPMITVSNNLVIIGDMEVNKPNFKFKRVIKKDYLPNAFDSVVNDVPLQDGFMNIVTISDNTNLYIDFILENQNEAYIYAVGNLLKVKRISSSLSPEQVKEMNTGNSGQQVSAEEKDTGVLLGFRTPTLVNEDGSVTYSKYKTLWLNMSDGKIAKPIWLDGLLLPRANGTFSQIDVFNQDISGSNEQVLEITNHNKNGTPVVEKSIMPTANYREITFVGKDYIGTEYKNKNALGDEYKLSTIDNINSATSLDMLSLFGSKGQDAYLNSREQFIDSKPSFVLDKYDLQEYSPSDITMFRKNGKWILNGRIDSDTVGVNDLSFGINISPVGALVNYDYLPISWNKIKQIEPKATDAFACPNSNLLLILTDNSIEVYELQKGEIAPKSVMTIPIENGDVPVMAEWATGDFVSLWNKTIEEKNK